MVHEAVSDTATVRAVFAIDPKGVIRAILYYPMSLGRNVDELVRIFTALQTADKTQVDPRIGSQVIRWWFLLRRHRQMRKSA